MAKGSLEKRIASLEGSSCHILIIWGENDPDRKIKEAIAEKTGGKATAILISEEDMGGL